MHPEAVEGLQDRAVARGLHRVADREPEAVREAEALLRVLDEQLLAVGEARSSNLPSQQLLFFFLFLPVPSHDVQLVCDFVTLQ